MRSSPPETPRLADLQAAVTAAQSRASVSSGSWRPPSRSSPAPRRKVSSWSRSAPEFAGSQATAQELQQALDAARAELAAKSEAQHALTEQAESVAATAAAQELHLNETQAALDKQRAELLAARNDLDSGSARDRHQGQADRGAGSRGPRTGRQRGVAGGRKQGLGGAACYQPDCH